MSVCSTCGLEKPEAAFRPRRGDGRLNKKRQCLECKRARQREWRADHPGYATQRRSDPQVRARHNESSRKSRERREVVRRYGVTQDEIADVRCAQGGRCAICRAEGPLHIDHDHTTGAFRALLCPKCNRGLGHFDDDSDRLLAAAEYLRRFADVGA